MKVAHTINDTQLLFLQHSGVLVNVCEITDSFLPQTLVAVLADFHGENKHSHHGAFQASNGLTACLQNS